MLYYACVWFVNNVVYEVCVFAGWGSFDYFLFPGNIYFSAIATVDWMVLLRCLNHSEIRWTADDGVSLIVGICNSFVIHNFVYHTTFSLVTHW